MEANTSSTIEPENMYGYINNLLMNPTALIILVIVVLIYIIIFVSLGDSSTSTTSSYTPMAESSGQDKTSGIIVTVVAIIFIVLFLTRLATNCLLLSYFVNMLFLFSLSYVNVLSFLISFPHDLLMQDELLRILGIRLFCHIDSLLRPLNNNKICCHFIHDLTFLTIFVLLLSLLPHFSF